MQQATEPNAVKNTFLVNIRSLNYGGGTHADTSRMRLEGPDAGVANSRTTRSLCASQNPVFEFRASRRFIGLLLGLTVYKISW